MSVNRMVTTAAFVTGVTADTRLSTGTRLRYPRPGYEAGQLVSELGIGQAATGGPTKPANGRFSKARQAATGGLIRSRLSHAATSAQATLSFGNKQVNSIPGRLEAGRLRNFQPKGALAPQVDVSSKLVGCSRAMPGFAPAHLVHMRSRPGTIRNTLPIRLGLQRWLVSTKYIAVNFCSLRIG